MKIEGLQNQLGQMEPKPAKLGGFAREVLEAIRKVDDAQKLADRKFVEFLEGKADAVELVAALNKAELSFRMMVEVKNRLDSALHELLRMQV